MVCVVAINHKEIELRASSEGVPSSIVLSRKVDRDVGWRAANLR